MPSRRCTTGSDAALTPVRPASPVTIREGTPEDAPSIARVHVDAWRSAYKGIVSQDFLDGLSYESRALGWLHLLEAKPEQEFVFVAEDPSGGVVGFAQAKPSARDPSFGGELQTIYVLDEARGRGVGRALLRAIAERFKQIDIGSMFLWVFTENASARRFYESLGGEPLEVSQFELGGVTMQEISYGWRDITSLIDK